MEKVIIIDLSGSFEGGGRKIANDLLSSVAFRESMANFDVIIFSSFLLKDVIGDVKLMYIPSEKFYRSAVKLISLLKLYFTLRKRHAVVYISWGVGSIFPSLVWNSISVLHNTIFMEDNDILNRFGFSSRILFFVMRMVLRTKIPFLKRIVVSSEYMESLLLRRFGADAVKSKVTKNFNVSDHGSKQIYSCRKRSENTKLRIVSVAAYSEHKCFEELLSGLNLFANRGFSFEFVNYGAKHGEEYWSRLQTELLMYDSLRGKVSLLGAELPRDDIPLRLLDSDIFLFVSCSESASLALIEASSLGVPIVCPDAAFIEIAIESTVSRFEDISGESICDALLAAVEKLDAWRGVPYCGLINAYNRRYCEIFEEVLGVR